MDRASVGRNEPCPCGSGRKYKQCCLNKDETKARQARAKAAAKEAKAAKKSGDEADEKGTSRSASDKVAQPRPSKAPTYQPWKKSATNTLAFQRMSTPRKVGGGG